MPDDNYVIDILALAGGTTILTDDGSGSDWLIFQGVYAGATEIRLSWTANAGVAQDGMGFYFNPTGIGHRLVVNGLIENARGSNGADSIQGNEVGNVLFGDNARTGPGLADTLDGNGGDDTVHGGAGNDLISGDSGADVLNGDAGRDSISGGDGTDTITGGRGADYLSGGGSDHDLLSYRNSAGGVQVQIGFGQSTRGYYGDAEGDTISGFRDVWGSDQGDVISDLVEGNLAFGYGDNIFRGFGGDDHLFLGGGADRGYGDGGDDDLAGEAGNDTLHGGGGRDTLTGGGGADGLWGEAGADDFVYLAGSDSAATLAGRDRIMDFDPSEGDRIILRGIDADPATAAVDGFVWRGSAGFNGVHGALRLFTSAGNTLVMVDFDGDRAADFILQVQGVVALQRTDFVI